MGRSKYGDHFGFYNRLKLTKMLTRWNKDALVIRAKLEEPDVESVFHPDTGKPVIPPATWYLQHMSDDTFTFYSSIMDFENRITKDGSSIVYFDAIDNIPKETPIIILWDEG